MQGDPDGMNAITEQPTIHVLKTWQPSFDHIATGLKTFDFRRNDRSFDPGDLLVLREFDDRIHTFRQGICIVRVTYILTRGFGLPEGYCILGIEKVDL